MSLRSRAALFAFFAATTVFGQQSTASKIAALPQDRLNEPWWAERHAAVLRQNKQNPDSPLIFLGDSITQNYEKSKLPDENFQPIWQTFYAPRLALNLGFSGDTTENLLWRMYHDELKGLHPQVVVLMIGTNNTGNAKQTAAQTEVGIDTVIGDLERRLPAARILLIGILPSAISPLKTAQDEEVNRYLAAMYSENPRVTYRDIGTIFFREGRINSSIFYDPRLPGHPGPLHPDTVGQRRMAEAIEPTLAHLMEDEPKMPLAAMTDINNALIPVERLEQDSYDWFARHHAALATAKGMHPHFVLLGDSITHYWAGEPASGHVSGEPAWEHAFGEAPVLNLGFGWDRTQNVLWRLRQGELDGVRPDFIVLNIGTNNLVGSANARTNTPAEIVEGIYAICHELKQRSPTSHIILMGVFPRGASPNDPLRKPIHEINRLLAQSFTSDPAITFLDIGSKFLAPDHSLPLSLMPDELHPNNAGYEIWADALREAFQPTH